MPRPFFGNISDKYAEIKKDIITKKYEEVGIELKAEDEKILATKVTLTIDGRRNNWIRDSFYFETTMEPDLNKATTNEVIQTKWLTFEEIKELPFITDTMITKQNGSLFPVLKKA